MDEQGVTAPNNQNESQHIQWKADQSGKKQVLQAQLQHYRELSIPLPNTNQEQVALQACSHTQYRPEPMAPGPNGAQHKCGLNR